MFRKIKKCYVWWLCCIWCLFFNAAVLQAAALQTVQTKYFDIIYNAEHSSATAALLMEYADGYAEEICVKLNKKMDSRIPIYIVHDTQALNGYFTPVPYRRIVLYDIASTTDGALANFTDTILQIFYHELTHAISLDTILDRYYTLAPMSFSEGVAVSFESLHGQGRVNDPLTKHHLIQNKIDGTTPTWQEAAGLRDMYPTGLWPYVYGGYFSRYLQEKYGMETYSKLWRTTWPFLMYGKFLSAYNTDITTEWNLFINTIPIPQTVLPPVPYPHNLEKSAYTALAASSLGFAYHDFNKNGVYFMAFQTQKPEKLFIADYSVSHLSFSEDGRYLVVTDEKQKIDRTKKKRLRIFDMQEKKFTGSPHYGTVAACFIDSTAVCAITVENQEFTAVILDQQTHTVKQTLFKAGPGHQFAALYSPCFIGNDEVAMIAANGTKRTILFINVQTGAIRVLPEDTAPYAIRYMQSVKVNDEYVLSFSWAEMDMLYRLGLYYPARGLLKLQHTDISGGSFFPVVIPDASNAVQGSEPTIVYAGVHGVYHRLYTLEANALTATTMHPLPFDAALATRVPPKVPNLSLLNPKPYDFNSWFWRAHFIPRFSVPNDMTKIGRYGLGVDVTMQDPTEKVAFNSSFLVFPKPFFLNGKLNFSLRFPPFLWDFIVTDNVDSASFRQRTTAFGTGVRLFIPLSYAWESLSLGYNANVSCISVLSNKTPSYYAVPYKYTLLRHEATMTYRNIQSSTVSGTPFFAKNKHGVQATLHYLQSYCFEEKAQAAVLEGQLQAALSGIPVVLTANGYFGFNTYFNPVFGLYIQKYNDASIAAASYLSLFGAYELPGVIYFASNGKWYAGCSTVCDVTLFSYDVQRGSSLVPVFCNRFSVHGGYAGLVTGNLLKKISNITSIYFDTAYLKAFLTMNNGLNVGFKYAHPLRIPKRFGQIKFFVEQEL
ncbi:MAG: hypothetical protein ACTTJ7_02365 [Treponema sp.]